MYNILRNILTVSTHVPNILQQIREDLKRGAAEVTQNQITHRHIIAQQNQESTMTLHVLLVWANITADNKQS